MILEFGENAIKGYRKNKCLAWDYSYEKINDLKNQIKKENIDIVIDDEEIYVKYITIPNIRKSKISDMVKNEMKYYFGSLNGLLFDYIIKSRDKNNLNLIVFYISSRKLQSLKSSTMFEKVKSIKTIQQYFYNLLKNKISEENYILVFYYDGRIYIMDIIKSYIMQDSVEILEDLSNNLLIIQYLHKFIEKYDEDFCGIKNIYFSNIHFCDVFSRTFDNYKCINLGDIKMRWAI